MAAARNEPCPCGSGAKYKACCGKRRLRLPWIAIPLILAFAAVAAWTLGGRVREASETGLKSPEGRVWSAEHGHWHEAPRPREKPEGPAPPGKVWSVEHGHWHEPPARGTSLPPGPAPPGKVWSVEHGHWHGEDGSEPPPESEPISSEMMLESGAP